MFIFVVLGITLIIIVKYISRSPNNIGAMGESRVSRQLFDLDKNKYLVLNNVFLQYENKISQIDHIVISTYGIFVIETKNYNGWIFGK